MPTRRDILQMATGALFTGARPTLADSSVLEVWADALIRVRYEDLSAEIVKRTKLCLLDNLGVLAFTSTLPEAHGFLARSLRNGGPREATVWGVNTKLPLETAVYANAYLIHGYEIDDSDFRSNYRPSCVCVPGPLSVAEFTRASGKDLLLALAIAYTVNGRLAVPLNGLQGLGFMPSSVVGASGTAAAAAKLMKFDRQQMLDALALATASGGGLFQYFFDQTEDKKLHVARAARAGIELALLAKQGWRGPRQAIEGTSGLLPSYLRDTGRKPDYDALKRNLNEFEGPLYIYPKFTSTSASIGPFLDALAPVLKRAKLNVADIAKFVVVREWPRASSFAQKNLHFEPPQTITGAQMNMNYSVALFLQRGSASVYDFTEAALRDKAVLGLAARVEYEEVPREAEYAIRVVLRDGRTFSAPFKYSRGAEPEPLRMDLRMQKFETLTRDRLNHAGRQQVINMVETLDTVRDVAAWTAAMHRLFKPLPRKAQ
jgi:2-methylcitrate dehydratase PrpD